MDQKSKTSDSIAPKRLTLTLKLGNSPLLQKIELLKAKAKTVTEPASIGSANSKAKKPQSSIPVASKEKAKTSAVAATDKEPIKSKKDPTVLVVAPQQTVSTQSAVFDPLSKETAKKDKKKAATNAIPKSTVNKPVEVVHKDESAKTEGADSKEKEDSKAKKKAKKYYKKKKEKKKEPLPPKKLLMSKERYGAMLLNLQQRFPDCFSKPTKPLAVGIHFELRETGLYSRSVIWDFLKVYCLMSQYKACLEAGRERVNLDGSVSSIV